MSEIKYLTREGLEALKQKLQNLKSKGRAEIARMIREARDKGDLSENAEYDAAKEAQGMLEIKISQLETTFASARVIDESKLDNSKVQLLANVTVINLKVNKTFKYKLVSEAESDVRNGKISISSPIGKGLLGRVVGEVVKVNAPAGLIELRIEEIRYESVS